MFYYKLKEGADGRIFIGTRTYSNGVIESDTEIDSPYVETVEVKQPDQATTNTEQTNEETI